MDRYIHTLLGLLRHIRRVRHASPNLTSPLRSPEERNAYWRKRGQSWRTEPEIGPRRQRYLAKRRLIIPDMKQGIYPFKGVKLSRADVEWLLATHENGRGSVDWSDSGQREREALDLRGADLRQADLHSLPLDRLRGGLSVTFEWNEATEEKRDMAAVHLEGAILRGAHLEEATLNGAYLEGAQFDYAHLGGAHLEAAHLEGATFWETHLEVTWLRKAHLEGAWLRKAYLGWALLGEAHLEGADLGGAQLRGASLGEADLERASLREAYLELASLKEAHLEEANLNGAHLEGADLRGAYLEGADLRGACLKGTDLRRAHLERTNLEGLILSDEKRSVGPLLADVYWGDTNLAIVNWAQVNMLGDEYRARYEKYDPREGLKEIMDTTQGKYQVPRNREERVTGLTAYEDATRANRQLAVALYAQGLNEDASRFAYRAHNLQRIVSRRRRKFAQWLFSWFLFVIAGYGYRPKRTVAWYLGVNVVCALIYFIVGGMQGIHFVCAPHVVEGIQQACTWSLTWDWGSVLKALGDAFAASFTAFHGRGLFSEPPASGDPRIYVAALESVVGVFIEATFIATFAQRFLGR